MIIPINLSVPQDRLPPPLQPLLAKLGSNEVLLIELQGSLDIVEGEKHGGEVGTFALKNDKPVLEIGHHLLEGKIVSLPKPLAILMRIKSDESEGSQYDVVTIVKRKITFSRRPVPIVKRS